MRLFDLRMPNLARVVLEGLQVLVRHNDSLLVKNLFEVFVKTRWIVYLFWHWLGFFYFFSWIQDVLLPLTFTLVFYQHFQISNDPLWWLCLVIVAQTSLFAILKSLNLFGFQFDELEEDDDQNYNQKQYEDEEAHK